MYECHKLRCGGYGSAIDQDNQFTIEVIGGNGFTQSPARVPGNFVTAIPGQPGLKIIILRNINNMISVTERLPAHFCFTEMIEWTVREVRIEFGHIFIITTAVITLIDDQPVYFSVMYLGKK